MLVLISSRVQLGKGAIVLFWGYESTICNSDFSSMAHVFIPVKIIRIKYLKYPKGSRFDEPYLYIRLNVSACISSNNPPRNPNLIVLLLPKREPITTVFRIRRHRHGHRLALCSVLLSLLICIVFVTFFLLRFEVES